MSNEATAETPQMDWKQVALNGGPPCFYVEGPQYCGRAERWPGHGNPAFHDFVSLESIVAEVGRLREALTTARTVIFAANRHGTWDRELAQIDAALSGKKEGE